MLFNSLTFVVFFAVVVTLYWSIRSWNARKNLLVVASYIFYGAWNPPFAALLFPRRRWIFGSGGELPGPKDAIRGASGWSPVSAMNLSMLGFFKYGNFLLGKFPMADGAHRHHLSTAASRHSSAGRYFLLHFPFSLLHARYLSRSVAAHQIAARFRARRFLFSSAGRRTDCARR